ncbi:uncharacterized protein [Amphiura filiformis]|uniref:uncharacterized protein n=1 Tax=Amphiura filiformis TaxID=82378 RepID=UPI003B213ED4
MAEAELIAGILSTILLCLLVIVVCWLLCVRKHGQSALIRREPGKYEAPIKYELSHQALPPLNGFLLRMVSYLYTSLIGSWVFVPSSLKRGHFDLIDRLVLDEVPIYQPLVPFDGPVSDGSDVSIDNLIIKEHARKDDSFRFESISDYYHKYRNLELTPSDVAEKVIEALRDTEEQDPQLRAIVQWDEKEIRRMATESTKRFESRRAQPLSVLDGVPVCVKEELSCEPYIFRVGTCFRSKKCMEDATIVTKLREAGAVIIGISNMHELGMGTTGNNVSRHHKTPRNPYNVNHYTGGSSSGSASAVAAGLCPVSIGTDGGGSVRIPAALCGLVGLKGTFGRFSCAGCAPLAFTVTHIGPLCGNVRDAAIMYGMLAGPDPKDLSTKWQPPITLEDFEKTSLTGTKMGIYTTYFEDASSEVVDICRKAVDFLEEQGAELVDIEMAELEEIRVAHIVAILGEFRTGLKQDFAEHTRELSSENALLLATATQFTCDAYVTANKQRARSISYLQDHVFDKVDVIITPATGVTAPEIHQNHLKYGFSQTSLTLDLMRFVSIGNLTGIPCLVVPVGYDSQGLPVGLQIMGRWWEDHVILRIGNILERFAEGNLRKPQVYYDYLE